MRTYILFLKILELQQMEIISVCVSMLILLPIATIKHIMQIHQLEFLTPLLLILSEILTTHWQTEWLKLEFQITQIQTLGNLRILLS